MPLFYDIESQFSFDSRATDVTKMIAITTALLNQLTPVEDLGYVIEEMYSVGMFRYKKRANHIAKVSNSLELLRKVDLVSFEVQCNFCLFDCSCTETHFQDCGCFYPTESALVTGTEHELSSDTMDCAAAPVETDYQMSSCSIYREVELSKKCNHRRLSSNLRKRRSYGDTFSCILASPSAGSPAKRGRPYVGRPPDPSLS